MQEHYTENSISRHSCDKETSTNVCMNERMDGYMYAWMNEWMDKWMNDWINAIWMYAWMKEWMYVCTNEQMPWTSEWMDDWINAIYMHERKNGLTYAWMNDCVHPDMYEIEYGCMHPCSLQYIGVFTYMHMKDV